VYNVTYKLRILGHFLESTG